MADERNQNKIANSKVTVTSLTELKEKRCGTTWILENLKGISGGCLDYPPEVLTYTQNGDNLEIDQALLDAWKPRA